MIDIVACELHSSSKCARELFERYTALWNGTPVFGDEFDTRWSFYSVLKRSDLAGMAQGCREALDYRRKPYVPPHGMPPKVIREVESRRPSELVEAAKEMVRDLGNWFEAIDRAEQDRFAYWH